MTKYEKAKCFCALVREAKEERTISSGTQRHKSTSLSSALGDQYQKPTFIVHVPASNRILPLKVTQLSKRLK